MPASALNADDDLVSYVNQITQLREAAKHLTNIASVLPTLYFAVISFSDLRRAVIGPASLVFLLPAVPWLFTVLIAAEIPLPTVLPNQTDAAHTHNLEQLALKYHRRLRLAYWCLVGGLVLLLIMLGVYLLFAPLPLP